MNSAIVGYIGAAIGVPIVFWLLRKKFTSLSVYTTSDFSFDHLRKKYSKWEFFIGICLILLASATGYIWWLLFSKISLLNTIRFKDAIIYVTATGAAWGLPAIFAGIVSGGLLADKLLNFMLKDRYAEYTQYQNAKYKINTKNLGMPLYVISISLILIMILMISSWYTIFTSDQILVKRLFSLSEEKLRYADVSSIRTAPSFIAPNGNIVYRREYVIEFANGKNWATYPLPTDLTIDQKMHIAQYVSQASGSPIKEENIFKKGELN